MIAVATLRLVDHVVVYALQYLLLALFAWSEFRYAAKHVSGTRSCRSSHCFLSMCSVFLTVGASIAAVYRLVDDSEAVWRDGLETGSMVFVLVLELWSIQRNVDHVYLFLFWTLRLLALSMDIMFDRLHTYHLLHTSFAIMWLCVCGTKGLRCTHWSSDVCATKPEPNLIRRLLFSWLDRTYQEAHRGSTAFYEGKFIGVLREDQRCETLLDMYEQSSMRSGYTAVNDGKDGVKEQERMFTIRKLLAPFRRDITLSGLNRLVLILFFFLCPYLLRLLLEENQSRMVQKWIVTALFGTSVLIALLNTQYQHATQDTGHRMQSILMGAIYRSVLADVPAAKASSSMLTNDTREIVTFMLHFHMVWSGPLIILITFGALWWIIGPISSLAGMCITALSIVVMRWLGRKISEQKKYINLSKNARVTLTTHSIEQMLQMKSDQLEEYFEQRIGEQRAEEMRYMLTSIRYNSLKHLLGIVTPMVVACGTFLFMFVIGSGALLTVQSMFVAIALFNIMRYPMSMMPEVWTSWKVTNVTLDQINAVVSEKQKNQRTARGKNDSTGHKGSFEKMQDVVHTLVDQLEGSVVDYQDKLLVIERGQFSIGEHVILRDVNIRLHKGTFTAISGTHGSGKTTLLRACIGTVHKTEGRRTVSWKRISYCPQTPWIHSGTIRSNILFGEQFDANRYEKVIHACCLEEDFKTFNNFDERVVSEGGHSLSGGQARRVSLARAIYRRADVYLFDDPLRSLDPNVCRSIFEMVFNRTNGLMAGCTCVFVSHDPDQLVVADKILVMSEGTINTVLDPSDLSAQRDQQRDALSAIETTPEEYDGDLQQQNAKRSKKPNTLNENNNRGNVPSKLYIDFGRMLKWKYCTAVVALEGLVTALHIGITILLAEWASSNERTNAKLIATGPMVLIWSVLVYAKIAVLHRGGLSLAKLAHDQMLSTVLRQPMEFFDRNDSGVVVNRFSNDLYILDATIIPNLRGVLSAFFSVVGTLLLFISKLLDVPFLFVIAVLAALSLIYGLQRLLSYHLQVARTLKRFEASSRSPIILQYNETVKGIDTIKAHDAEDRFLGQFQEKVDKHKNYIYHNIAANRWIGIRLEFIGAIVIYYVALLTVSHQSVVGLTFVGIIVSYVLALIPSLNSFFQLSGQLEENIISFERVTQYLNLPRETSDEEGADYPTTGEEQLPVRGPIEYRDVSLTHGDGSTVLHNITLTIEAGEKLGIVGRTGSGKSSFIGTLFRFYPRQTTGIILVDGVDLAKVSLDKLRRTLTLVPQSTSLFSGLVRNFIDPCNIHSDDRLNATLKECELSNVLLSTTLQDLSVGQRQLLCLVRGLLRAKPIIILDEATSALDEGTENLILKVLQEQFHDRTVLMIAHHLNTVESCDRILWMQEGRIRKLAPLVNYTSEERNELGFRD